jgi:hypothetical protein
MQTAIIPILLTVVGCSSGPALELMETLSGEERTQARELLATDAHLAMSGKTIIGQEPVHAALAALPAGGRASGHHDVAQLVLPDAVLFAKGSDAVDTLALLEGEGSDELPAVLVDYVASWNEPDSARRDVLLAAFAAGGRYVDPTVDAVGRDAFASHLTSFRASMAGITFERTSRVRREGDWYVFAWS